MLNYCIFITQIHFVQKKYHITVLDSYVRAMRFLLMPALAIDENETPSGGLGTQSYTPKCVSTLFSEHFPHD